MSDKKMTYHGQPFGHPPTPSPTAEVCLKSPHSIKLHGWIPNGLTATCLHCGALREIGSPAAPSVADEVPKRDWDEYERAQFEKQYRSFGATQNPLWTATESAVHWNRMYRELLADTNARVVPREQEQEILIHCCICGEGFQLNSLLGEHFDNKHAAPSHSQLAEKIAEDVLDFIGAPRSVIGTERIATIVRRHLENSDG